MKRLHVSVSVDDLDRAIDFYSTVFGQAPTVIQDDYAKWMVDDPRVNFAVSTRGGRKGVNHLGIQVEDQEDLTELYRRIGAAKGPLFEEGDTTCCYANSRKSWILDPAGVAWEAFLTHSYSAQFGFDASLEDHLKPDTATA